MTPPSAPARRRRPATVLVIDDNPDFRSVLVDALREEGFSVAEAADGDEGLALARRLQPDLVLLDIIMPGRDGFEVCQELREDPRIAHIKVVMLTAQMGTANVARSHLYGADAYIAKPFELDRLLSQIRSLLSGPSPAGH
jgi:CheY-like chemotaxis protein